MTVSVETISASQTQCCIVGGGPGGAVLALLLARKGVRVALLEAHKDFDREFRGDSLNSSVLEVMDEMGLAEELLAMPHAKIRKVTVQAGGRSFTTTDYTGLKTRYPFIFLLPQNRFIEFIVGKAQACPSFRLLMGAKVQDVIRENGRVAGVVYQGGMLKHEIRAALTVGADGRSSRLREIAGLKPIETSPPMDVLWFRVPRREGDGDLANLSVYVGRGYYVALVERPEHWQVSYVIPKGSFAELKSRGLDAFRKSVTDLLPAFEGRLRELKDWSGISFLSVRSSRLPRWHVPGLLLIGDAAHVMSSVGGLGINCAIMDAVAAANVLATPLKAGLVRDKDLAEVQRRRAFPTRVMQTLQSLAQKNIVARAFDPEKPFRVPFFLQIPFIRNLAARVTAMGVGAVHLEERPKR